ncbi:FAD:protein FMN transferase [Pseudomonas sp. MMS21-TM103]|uniref:FAD:protein FMN transferase n=1 Tax=Pseudomonas sp. MMS21 TM103 TaxID=2886506 RepID=UPI001EE00F05|nr:FAD:protein FMN transferase [Pseudomonas sp. MMS21 TM103]MCG4455617.1 FAD:protein FMN transferase [Pseudomonas sp. MMS21 TM103]
MKLVVFQPVIAVAFAAALTGCLHSETVEEFGGPTMGSTYSVKYVTGEGVADGLILKAETEAILAEVDQQMSTYRDDSVISAFNRAPAGSCMAAPAGMLEVVRMGLQLAEESGGAFDPTIEPLLNLWGFGPQARVERVPTADELAEARRHSGYRNLRIDGQRLCKDVDLQLDLNSMAAGYTVDKISVRLAELGVANYLVEVTGELKAVGKKPDGQPWRIAIEAPLDDQRVAQRVLQLDGYGISTSGDYRNYFEENGVRYSHTLDPHTGAPITHKLAAVTVADSSALRADGLSTSLMVLGPEQGLAYAEQAGIAAFFVTREGTGFVTRGTTAFEQQFAAGEEQ